MRLASAVVGIALGLVASSAAAQGAPEDGESAGKSGATEPSENADGKGDAKPETKPGEASPPVKKQVGLGTEKEPPSASKKDTEETPKGVPEASLEQGEDDDFGHMGQFGLRAAFLGGYRMIFRYDESGFCREPKLTEKNNQDYVLVKDQQKVCGHWGAPAVDLALSFGVLDSIEPYLWARFGLDGDAQTNTQNLKVLGAGLRVYASSEARFKFFIEPAFGMQLENGGENPLWQRADHPDANVDPGERDDDSYKPQWDRDFWFHLGLGPQYDFASGFGVYAHFGLNVGVLRAIHATLDMGLGVQVRVP